MKLYGSPDRLGQYPCEAVVITDSFITDTHIYIQEPTLTFNEHTNQYVEMLKIFSSPKNMGEAEKLAEHHNTIYHSPLMKALRES
jgi:hypothetical protein